MRGRYSHAEPGSGTHIRDQTHAGGHELERQQGGTATVLGVVPGVMTGVRRVRWPWAAKGTVPERRSSNCGVTTGSKTSVCRVASVVPNSLRPHGLARPAPLATEILQARILEWAAMPSSRPRDRPDPGIEPSSLLSHALAGGFFTTSATWEAPKARDYNTERCVWESAFRSWCPGWSQQKVPTCDPWTDFEHVYATLFLKLQACSILYKKEEFIKLSKRCVTTTFPTQPPSHPHTTQEDWEFSRRKCLPIFLVGGGGAGRKSEGKTQELTLAGRHQSKWSLRSREPRRENWEGVFQTHFQGGANKRGFHGLCEVSCKSWLFSFPELFYNYPLVSNLFCIIKPVSQS